MQQHRKLTLLLNVLLTGGASYQSRRSAHFWAGVHRGEEFKSEWVQKSFFAPLDAAVIDELSPPASEALEALELEDYREVGIDGKGLRVPADSMI